MLGRSNGLGGLGAAADADFLDRHGLAGEGRLVDEQVLGGEQAQVGRDHVAGREGDDVARNELLDRDFGEAFDLGDVRRAAAPLHARGGLHQGPQLGGGLVGAMLLDEGRDDRQDHHHGDDDGGARVAEEVGHHRKREQQDIERVLGAIDDLVEDAGPAFLRDLVRPEAPQPFAPLALRRDPHRYNRERASPPHGHIGSPPPARWTPRPPCGGARCAPRGAPADTPSLIKSLERILPPHKIAARAASRVAAPLYTATECRLWFRGK